MKKKKKKTLLVLTESSAGIVTQTAEIKLFTSNRRTFILNKDTFWMCTCITVLLSLLLLPGILHKGNGENVFLSQQPPIISTVMGNGFYRSVPCGPGCSGAARDMMLFAPVALASGPDGSLYIGDFNFVRRVHPDGYTRTILELK